MEELINQISTQTGISNEQARQAVQMVVDFVKTKLPPPLAGQVDGMLNSGAADSAVDQAFGSLGGLFGKKD